jgi:hypothetical protein
MLLLDACFPFLFKCWSSPLWPSFLLLFFQSAPTLQLTQIAGSAAVFIQLLLFLLLFPSAPTVQLSLIADTASVCSLLVFLSALVLSALQSLQLLF